MKLPPIEKVYEAWTALADGRVQKNDDNTAIVTSSDGERTYSVKYDPDTDTYYSNDNATFWRGYPGYPVIAYMMLTETLPFDYEYAQQWAGINWTQLNSQYKRDYAAAVRHIEDERGIDQATAEARAQLVMNDLEALPCSVKRLVRKAN